MTSTRIEYSYNKIARLADPADLAEMLFPCNRSHQHAFLVIWITLKWQADGIVPNLAEVACNHGLSRRTYERVRAKMRQIGLIDHVSQFHAAHGGRDGWVLSTRFERSLNHLARKVVDLKDTDVGSKDKDVLLIHLAEARKDVAGRRKRGNDEWTITGEGSPVLKMNERLSMTGPDASRD